MRLMTWNLWGLRGGVSAVVAVLRDADADVVCLQECPRWPGGQLALRALARRSGLRVVADGWGAGVAVLIRREVGPGSGALVDDDDARPASVTWHTVVREPRRRQRWWWAYPRAVALARIATPEGEVLVGSVHLDVDAAARLGHATRIAATLAGEERVVLAGDLNEVPGGAARLALAQELTDLTIPPTYPVRASVPAGAGARPPHRAIDGVLVRGLEQTEAGRIAVDPARIAPPGRGPVSDHLPVLVTLTWR